MFFKSGTIFSKYLNIMSRKVILFAFLVLSLNLIAQKAQRIGYIDMEYILENIPEYSEAQSQINTKANSWQTNIERKQNEIDGLKADLRNEKILLTSELIEEREEDIQIKELELKKLQLAYFGTDGELYLLRQQLVKPIQDLVYNAVQDIAKKRKYDFVLDNSTDLIMLYTNKNYDISELIISSINREKKSNRVKSRKTKNTTNTQAEVVDENNLESDVLNEDEESVEVVKEEDKAQEKLDAKALRRAELLKKIEEKKAAQLKKREELLKANEAKRQQRIKEIEEKKAKDNKNN